MPKALVLLSGGLDSMLAAKLLLNQGVEVTGLTFTTPFFGAKKAEESAKQLGIDLKVIDISKDHFKIVKKPPHGYGKNVNPCIDCHGLMFRKAKELIKKEGFDFVATGEVLGQRPMSQNKGALKIVEKLAGLEGKILRPMSAKLLDETEVEQKGIVDRDKLLAIKGKSRKEQMALAKELGFKKYATPGGGCLLTDPGYAQRFKKLQKIFSPPSRGQAHFDLKEAELIKYGRLFVEQDYMFLVGREHEENLKLKKIADKNDILLEVKEVPGPITLLHFFRVTKQPVSAATKKIALKKAAGRTVRYANRGVREFEEVGVVSLDNGEEIKIETGKIFNK
ncbi:tRNA 4-thiouridine(8) synthase ThiI [Patescibacteria group bacterium]